MKWTAYTLAALLVFGGLLALGLSTGAAGEGDPTVPPGVADLGAIYRSAFDAGDAEALARCFTDDAEYVDEGLGVTTGRDGIREVARAFFETHPGVRIASSTDRCRVVGDDAVLLDGKVTLLTSEGTLLSRSQVTVLCVRSEGEWRISSLREGAVSAPDVISPREHLGVLSWLVGDWVEEGEHSYVRSSCQWSEEGPYLIQSVEVHDAAEVLHRSNRRIAWDPILRRIRSWSWDSEGGFGEAVWTPTPKGWILTARAVSADGLLGTGSYRVTLKSEHTMQWEAVDWIVGDLQVENRTYDIVRRPPSPAEE